MTCFVSRLEQKNENSDKFYTASVNVWEGEIISASQNENTLEMNPNVICELKLDRGIHHIERESSII